ncbi:MAG: MmcQ/YjbR family DNA-binding protein [Solirubrobacteraceae bacterium]
MSPAALRDHCLDFPGSVETFPFGPATSVFKVARKMFAVSQLAQRPLRVSLKCEPQLAEQLRAAHAAVGPGYQDMIEDSYDLVVSQFPAFQRRALGWSTDQR